MTIQQIQDEVIEIRAGRKLFVRHWILQNPSSSAASASKNATTTATTINLVCVHGTAASQEQYLSLWKALDEGNDRNLCIRVWAYDAIGCGQSPTLGDHSSYTDDEQVQDLTILLELHVADSKHKYTTYLMGHSYGPTWIYKYLLKKSKQQPTDIDIGGLILISSGLRCKELVVGGPTLFHYLPIWALKCLQPMLTASFLKIGFSPTTHKEQPELIQAAKSANNQNDMQTCVYYYHAHDWLEHLSVNELLPTKASSNILVLHGTDDEVIPIHCGQALANELETDLVSIPNASHMVLMEQAQVVAEHILDFWTKNQQ